MSKTTIAAAAFAALASTALGLATSAQAADFNYRAPYTVNQPLNAYSWAGPYLGANLGYAFGSIDNDVTKPDGVFGGVQGGYNWQNGQFVFGVEGDLQASSADDTFAPYKFSNPWFGTVRGRVGYAFNNVLLYGTAVSPSANCAERPSACRNRTPMRAGPPASAPSSASTRTGPQRSNTSTSISRTAASRSPELRTVISSA